MMRKNNLTRELLRRTLYGIAAGVLLYLVVFLHGAVLGGGLKATLIMVVGIVAVIGITLITAIIYGINAYEDDSPQLEAAKLLSLSYPHLRGVPHSAIIEYMQKVPLYTWGVQIAAFKTPSFAESLRHELQAKGLEAFVIYHNQFYKVRVGRFYDSFHAAMLESNLRSQGLTDAFRVTTTNYDEFIANFGVWYEEWLKENENRNKEDTA